jgi:hypothetical protein
LSVKLLMSWDIKPGRDQDYFEFVIHEWVPGVNKLGIETVAAWYTVYSRENDPQILAEAITEDVETMRSILNSPDWQQLHDKLLQYVDNYTHKVVNITNGGFQL